MASEEVGYTVHSVTAATQAVVTATAVSSAEKFDRVLASVVIELPILTNGCR